MSKVATGSIAGISLTTVVVLIATNGDEFAAALAASWQFVIMVTTKTPAGLASFLLAWALGLLVMYSLRNWLPESRRPDAMHIRLAAIELLSALSALVAAWSQTPSLLGFLLSLVAGLSVSPLYRLLASAISAAKRRIYLEPPETPL